MKITNVKAQSIRIPVPQMWVVHFGKTMDVALVVEIDWDFFNGHTVFKA